MRWTTDRFPHLESRLRELAQRHRELRDEPLHLAMAYDPGRDRNDVFLLEVLGNFASNEVNPDRELFEVAFGSSKEFPMADGQRLHLISTSPVELQSALEELWPSAEEIRKAVRLGNYEVLSQDDLGAAVLEWLRD